MAFRVSDWLYFLWHGINKCISSSDSKFHGKAAFASVYTTFGVFSYSGSLLHFKPRCQKSVWFQFSFMDRSWYLSFKQEFVCKWLIEYLGLLKDCNLSWSFHINYISIKVSKSVGVIAKLRHFVPQETLITLYWALIHPYLNYGIEIWGQSSKSLFNKLLRLQKRVLRLIFFKK